MNSSANSSPFNHPVFFAPPPPTDYHPASCAPKNRAKYVWSHSEDQLLLSLVATHGPTNWKVIADNIPKRKSKQCRERYFNHLREGIVKTEWTEQEEWYLYLGVQAFGKKWSKISGLMSGRTDNSIKNHWNCKMRRSIPQL